MIMVYNLYRWNNNIPTYIKISFSSLNISQKRETFNFFNKNINNIYLLLNL